MSKILTIIIPVYNMEKYLQRCLDSVVNSEYISEIQVLVINDGSKDNSLAIAKTYSDEYPESVEVIDKSNGGWGSAVNLAFSLARGKYLKLLDSDDWFDTKEFDKLIEFIRDCDADIVATAFTKIFDDVPNEIRVYDQQIIGRHDLITRMEQLNFAHDLPMAAVCYRTALIKEIALKVPERFYGDVPFTVIPLAFAKTLVYTPFNVYQYYLGRADHSTGIQGYINHYKDYFNMAMSLVDFYISHNLSGGHKTIIEKEIGIQVKFCHYLTLSPTYLGGRKDAVQELKKFNTELKGKSPELYSQTSKVKIKGIPYIAIWRNVGINLLNISKWI